MIVAGIDYSLNGPAVAVFDTSKTFNYENVDIYYLTGTKKYVINDKTLQGDLLMEQPDNFHRYEYLKNWVYDKLEECEFVIIENYSYGSKGSSIFNLAESTGITKQKLWSKNIQVEVVPPKAIKKFYTGSGNASKSDMYKQFKSETKIDLVTLFDYQKAEIVSPISDVCDSWAILKYGLDVYDFVNAL